MHSRTVPRLPLAYMQEYAVQLADTRHHLQTMLEKQAEMEQAIVNEHAAALQKHSLMLEELHRLDSKNLNDLILRSGLHCDLSDTIASTWC